jgi:hypothetical protein
MIGDTVRGRDFIAAVYDGVEGYLNVRTLPPVEQAFFKVADVDALEAFVAPRRDRNAYIGAAVRVNTTDGSLAGCGPLPALFADLDFKDFATEAAARRQLAAAPLAPSIVIQSGGGLQPWWKLREPMDLQRDAPAAKSLLRRLAVSLNADLAAAEPARILRLPNTKNYKYMPPRSVKVEVFEISRQYNVCDFDAYLPDEPHDVRVLAGPTPDAIPQGSRNAHLTSLAGSMRKRGMAEASIAVALLAENEARCRPPLSDADVRRIAKSVGRYAPDPSSEPTAFVNSLPELLERASTITEPRWLIAGLLPGDGTSLVHAQPREYKTLIAQALMVATTTGTPAFGLERLQVAEAVPAWYITEEDGWWRVTNRLGQLVQGYGLDRAPELLHVSAGKGLNLDTPEWQERIIATAREQGYRLVVIDPLRSVTEAADQGPRELKPFALFLRRFIRETGAVVLIVHHDTKPPAAGADQRRRPQRASGGGIFSIADSPIHIDRVDETRRMLVPCAFKFAADPPAVTVRLEHGPGWLRLTGEETTAAEPDDAAVDLRILDYLKNSPYSYGNAVTKGVRANKELVLQRLKALSGRGLVDSVEEGKGIKWFARRAS